MVIFIASFILGFVVTIAEPDLQVLAQTVPHINNTVLLVTVGVGVGFFLCVCMIRILTGVRLRWLLIAFYAVVFILAAFSKPDFLGIAWAVPIKSVGGGKILAYLNDGRQDARYTPEFNFSYELIVAIANEGRTDAVMNAARRGRDGRHGAQRQEHHLARERKVPRRIDSKRKRGYSNRRA